MITFKCFISVYKGKVYLIVGVYRGLNEGGFPEVA